MQSCCQSLFWWRQTSPCFSQVHKPPFSASSHQGPGWQRRNKHPSLPRTPGTPGPRVGTAHVAEHGPMPGSCSGTHHMHRSMFNYMIVKMLWFASETNIKSVELFKLN